MPMVSPSMRRAWFAPVESKRNSPVGLPSLSRMGSACMQRSTTDIRREITHSRSRPVLMMAFLVAMADSSLMRLRIVGFSRSQSRARSMVTGEPMAIRASAMVMPMARARQ